MRIDVFALFPDLVDSFCNESLLGKARGSGLLDLRCHDIREHTTDVHRTVDDAPFGGGAGMVMKPEPIFAAVEAARPAAPAVPARPRRAAVRSTVGRRAGRPRWVQPAVRPVRGDRPSGPRHTSVDGEISVGDVVLSGGEVAACLVIEAVTRLLRRSDGQRGQPGDREFRRRRPARGAAIHPARGVPRLDRAGGAAQRRPRCDRPLAPRPSAPPDPA